MTFELVKRSKDPIDGSDEVSKASDIVDFLAECWLKIIIFTTRQRALT